MNRTRLAFVILALVFLTPMRGFAADGGPGVDGELFFRVHCASCHGLNAKGDGPMRDVLKVAPADLTVLRKDHDGEFPRERTREIIDGRGEVRGHGSSEMPVWGMTFQEPGRTENQEDEVRRRIEALLRHLESVQE